MFGYFEDFQTIFTLSSFMKCAIQSVHRIKYNVFILFRYLTSCVINAPQLESRVLRTQTFFRMSTFTFVYLKIYFISSSVSKNGTFTCSCGGEEGCLRPQTASCLTLLQIYGCTESRPASVCGTLHHLVDSRVKVRRHCSGKFAKWLEILLLLTDELCNSGS